MSRSRGQNFGEPTPIDDRFQICRYARRGDRASPRSAACDDHLPDRRTARPRRGPARARRGRSLPLVGGPGRPAHRRVVDRPGRPHPVVAGRDAGPRAAGRAARRADAHRVRRRAGAAGRPGVLHAPRPRPGPPRALRAGRRRGAGAARRVGARPVGADHAGPLVAVAGGHAAGVPGIGGRRRALPAARGRRGHRRAARRPRRPLPVLAGGVAARRRGVLLRAAARPRPGARGRAAVPPAGVAAPGGRADRLGRERARRRARPHLLLRADGVRGRPVAGRGRRAGDRAAGLGVDRRPARFRGAAAGALGRRRGAVLGVGWAPTGGCTC